MTLRQGLYSGQIEIWTATTTAKDRDKLGQFKNFQAQSARKLTKSGRNKVRFYKFPIQTLMKKNVKSGPFPQMSRIRDNVP